MSSTVKRMFLAQEELNMRVGKDPNWVKRKLVEGSLNPIARQQVWEHWMSPFIHAMQSELAELQDCFPWKHWRRIEDQPWDLQNARVEVIDLFHFWMSLAMGVGLDPESFIAGYFEKNRINHNRQDVGYTVKNEDDCRSILDKYCMECETPYSGSVCPRCGPPCTS